MRVPAGKLTIKRAAKAHTSKKNEGASLIMASKVGVVCASFGEACLACQSILVSEPISEMLMSIRSAALLAYTPDNTNAQSMCAEHEHLPG